MAKDRIDRDELVSKLVELAGEAEDPLRAMAEMVTEFLMEAEVTAKVGAEPYERSGERTTHRNGYRERRWDTRLGTLRLKIPKLRQGGYVPSFIEHRRRSEQALISVIQEAVVQGVSTRKIEAVLAEFGIAGVSAGQVSQLCAALDEKVRQFQERELGEIRYLWVDALYEKVRADGRVESMAVVMATGVNPQGRREVLGFDVLPAESEEGWTQFFKSLKERGLRGVRLVVSDAHSGLKAAVRKVLKAEEFVGLFAQRFPQAMEVFEAGIDDVLSYLHYPTAHHTRISSTNPLERLNLEIRRRPRVVGIFPHTGACVRLIGMLLVEQHEEWLTAEKAYLSFEDAAEQGQETKVVSLAAGQ